MFGLFHRKSRRVSVIRNFYEEEVIQSVDNVENISTQFEFFSKSYSRKRGAGVKRYLHHLKLNNNFSQQSPAETVISSMSNISVLIQCRYIPRIISILNEKISDLYRNEDYQVVDYNNFHISMFISHCLCRELQILSIILLKTYQITVQKILRCITERLHKYIEYISTTHTENIFSSIFSQNHKNQNFFTFSQNMIENIWKPLSILKNEYDSNKISLLDEINLRNIYVNIVSKVYNSTIQSFFNQYLKSQRNINMKTILLFYKEIFLLQEYIYSVKLSIIPKIDHFIQDLTVWKKVEVILQLLIENKELNEKILSNNNKSSSILKTLSILRRKSATIQPIISNLEVKQTTTNELITKYLTIEEISAWKTLVGHPNSCSLSCSISKQASINHNKISNIIELDFTKL